MSFATFKTLIQDLAGRYGYDAALLASQIAAESAFNPTARSKVGAMGLMQFMPTTWADWGNGQDPDDPAANIDAGIRYMKWLLGQLQGTASPQELALAAYNWGIGRVKNLISQQGRSDWPALRPFMPAETQGYVDRIMSNAGTFRAAVGAVAISGTVVLALVGGLLGLALLRRIL
ncbi:MAG TPA: lytic transglycosylase domain-containing protein [Holophagaceae bacterium]|nr:lytic transglycosylase domain-containing protein [Holophagaceae bacterium]